MLKGIDPLLTPALLQVLAAMGHGDETVLTSALQPDANVIVIVIVIVIVKKSVIAEARRA